VGAIARRKVRSRSPSRLARGRRDGARGTMAAPPTAIRIGSKAGPIARRRIV